MQLVHNMDSKIRAQDSGVAKYPLLEYILWPLHHRIKGLYEQIVQSEKSNRILYLKMGAVGEGERNVTKARVQRIPSV